MSDDALKNVLNETAKLGILFAKVGFVFAIIICIITTIVGIRMIVTAKKNSAMATIVSINPDPCSFINQQYSCSVNLTFTYQTVKYNRTVNYNSDIDIYDSDIVTIYFNDPNKDISFSGSGKSAGIAILIVGFVVLLISIGILFAVTKNSTIGSIFGVSSLLKLF